METIRLTCANYIRVMPLAARQVQPDGVGLDLLLSEGGAWKGRAEMLRRALQDPTVDGGEASMGIHLRRIDQGDRSFVALPVFVLRNFAARDLYVRQGSTLRQASDLIGKRIGMYSWGASGSIWYRHFLAHCGVDASAVQWTIGDIDQSYAVRNEPGLPANAVMAPAGRALSAMLLDGELDAIYSPPRPAAYNAQSGPIVRLYPDPRAVETQYYRATGILPPQHLMVMRRDVWERDKSVARRITDAFIASETAFEAAMRAFPYASPWLEQEIEAADAALGASPYRHGLEANRATLEAFAEQGFKLGLTKRLVAVEDYFAEFLAS